MISGDDVLLTATKGHIFTMTINREERRNAISSELMSRIAREWERFNEDDDLWVAIFTGAGDVAFSAGSACASGTVKPSHVLQAMGVSDAEAGSALRVSLGWNSTPEDVECFIRKWSEMYNRMKPRLGVA